MGSLFYNLHMVDIFSLLICTFCFLSNSAYDHSNHSGHFLILTPIIPIAVSSIISMSESLAVISFPKRSQDSTGFNFSLIKFNNRFTRTRSRSLLITLLISLSLPPFRETMLLRSDAHTPAFMLRASGSECTPEARRSPGVYPPFRTFLIFLGTSSPIFFLCRLRCSLSRMAISCPFLASVFLPLFDFPKVCARSLPSLGFYFPLLQPSTESPPSALLLYISLSSLVKSNLTHFLRGA